MSVSATARLIQTPEHAAQAATLLPLGVAHAGDAKPGDTLVLTRGRGIIARGTGWTYADGMVTLPVLRAGGGERFVTVPHDVVHPTQTFTCQCGDYEYPIAAGHDESMWCACGLRLDQQREAIADARLTEEA